ncbi:MAG: aliphatic sulfonate ABC transporter substrate-binding protein [Acetobacteraceae bacterium]|nr:aliphatic sulfonate ABC transporter substrate-binding protein [Acetobacteraceae bacterium]
MTTPATLTRRGFAAAAAGLLAMPAIGRAATAVKIGYQKNGSLVIVRQQRLLEQQGLAAEFVEFTSGPSLLEALNAGAVDFGATGDTPPIFAQAAGSGLVYVGAQPLSGANEAVLVRHGGPVHTLADLKGRRVAFTKGSSAHNMVVKVLAKAGLTPSDIQPVYLQPPDAAAAFRSGSLDAWAIWDPFYAIAQVDPATKVLTTAEGIAPSNSFFVARRAFADGQADTVVQVLHTINDAAAWARANPEKLAQMLSAVTGVPIGPQRVSAARGVYAVQPLDPHIVAQQQEIADSFAALRIIPAKIDVQAAVWTHPWQLAAR